MPCGWPVPSTHRGGLAAAMAVFMARALAAFAGCAVLVLETPAALLQASFDPIVCRMPCAGTPSCCCKNRSLLQALAARIPDGGGPIAQGAVRSCPRGCAILAAASGITLLHPAAESSPGAGHVPTAEPIATSFAPVVQGLPPGSVRSRAPPCPLPTA
jgi:hypothetical protein